MKISSNTNFIEMMNLNKKKNPTLEEKNKLNEARKNDPQLDKALYLKDLNELHEEISKAEKLAKKVAKGEPLTPEEREFLEKTNPYLLKEAEKAKEEAEQLRAQLKRAESKEAAQNIIGQASFKANAVAKYNEQYGNLLKEAIAAVCEEEKGYEHKSDMSKIEKSFQMDENKGRINYYS